MGLTYVCSPLSAPTRAEMLANAAKANTYMVKAEKEFGDRAVAPHAYLPYLLDDTVAEERALALEFDTKLLKLCTRLVVYGDVISGGMRVEIEEATKLGIPILYRPGICPDEKKNNVGTNTAKHRCPDQDINQYRTKSQLPSQNRPYKSHSKYLDRHRNTCGRRD